MIASFFVLAGLLLQGADSTEMMTTGISRQLATRRASQIGDVRYALSLDLTGRDTARGRVRVSFVLQRSADVILDFRGPSLSGVAVNAAPLATLDWNKAHLRIPGRLLKAGVNTMDASFSTVMAAAGWPIIRYP